MTNHGFSHIDPSSKSDLPSKNLEARPQQTANSHHGISDAQTVITKTARPGPLAEQQTVISNKPSMSGVPSSALVKSNELGRFLEGEVLDHFRLDEFIGGGGMGAVFRAHDTKLSRKVAVKVLSRGQQADKDTKARFQLEGQSAARLDHENIARVYYVGEFEGWDYIVFEYIDGVNIRDLVATKGALSLEDAVSFTLQVAEALQHASRREVVHRDIKPSNVLITVTGRAKLVDMGLARLHQVEVDHEELTVSGVTLGTFDYISPEQARDPRHADVRSDIYSLGCTLFYMLAARPPFSDGTVLQKLLSHTNDKPPDIRQFRPDVPPEVMTLLGKMLAKCPDDRHRSPSELIGELLLLSERLGLAPGGQAGTVWVAPTAPSLTWWERCLPWVMPVLLFIVVVFGVDYFAQGPDIKVTQPRNAIATYPLAEGEDGGTSGRNAEQAVRNPSHPDGQTSGVPASPRVPQSLNGQRDSAKTPHKALVPDPRGDTTTAQDLTVGRESHSAAKDDGASPQQAKGQANAKTGPENVAFNAEHATSGESPHQESPASSSIVLVVGETDDRPNAEHFETLDQALVFLTNHREELADLEAIELCYTGRRQLPQQPIEFGGLQIVIRAGAGHAPVLTFHSEDSAKSSMITLAGGELVMRDIHLEVDLRQPVDHWTLFDLRDAARVNLSSCTLTIRNNNSRRRTYYEAVSFFHIEPSSTFRRDEEAKVSGLWPQIQMRDCLVRGEATLLWAMEARPFEFEWENGILISTECLLRASGCSSPVDGNQAVRLRFEDVTAVADKGLCSMIANEHASHMITVDVECENTVLATSAGIPLIKQSGSAHAEAQQQQFVFRGHHNVFVTEPVAGKETTYWRIVTLGENNATVDLGFSAWSHFLSSVDNDWYEVALTPLALPSRARPAHQLTAEDYAWRRLLTPRELANYSLDAGCRAEDLPSLPAGRNPPASSLD